MTFPIKKSVFLFFKFLPMKKYIQTIGLVTLCTFAFSSCKKAGTDGDATLVVSPAHHGDPIVSNANYRDTIYVKFNAKDLPSDPTHNYDAIFVGEPGEDHVHCPNLHTGTYFLYATGWDTSINPPFGQRVSGGMSVKIKYKERKQEINVTVPVTE
jgi:hypothetical protein